nr:septum formation family protein [Actinomycetota bacterium]
MRAFRSVLPAITLGLLAAAGCSDDESVFNQEAGECVESISDLGTEISELPEADCAQPHDGEVIGTFTHDGDDFPGQEGIGQEAFEGCAGVFADYVGVELIASTLDLFPISPTQQSWDEIDDRESICVAVGQNSEQLEG